jgi:hypothetical protein
MNTSVIIVIVVVLIILIIGVVVIVELNISSAATTASNAVTTAAQTAANAASSGASTVATGAPTAANTAATGASTAANTAAAASNAVNGSTSGASTSATPAGITAVANLPVGTSIQCTAGATVGAFYRYQGYNTIAGYPTPQIAASWNPNWGSNASSIDCTGLTIAPNLAMNPAAASTPASSSTNAATSTGTLPVATNSYSGVVTAGQTIPLNYAVSCSAGDPLPTTSGNVNIYRLTGDYTISHYPTSAIAASCDPNWQTGTNRQIDCTGFTLGTDQVMC